MTEIMFDTLWPQGKWRSQLSGLQSHLFTAGVVSHAEYTGRFSVKQKVPLKSHPYIPRYRQWSLKMPCLLQE